MALFKCILFCLLGLTALASLENSEEIAQALDTDETCDADGNCGLELRQLRGEFQTSLKKEVETCSDWVEDGGECDAESGEIPRPNSTECEDECSEDVCCMTKASCSFFTVMGGCVKMVVPENVTNKVWIARKEELGQDLYCASSEQNEESCGKSCCALESCKACSGATYPEGCKAGSVGECAACPTESSCSTGKYRTCGDGVLGKCQECKNAPENAHYTGSSMTAECPWACNKYYEKKDGKCVPVACASWTGKCDATTQVTLDPTTSCKGVACSADTCCAAKATCSQYYSSAAANASATCALVKDATKAGKVWAPTVATAAETLYCTGSEANAANCEKACCSEQSCAACGGKHYTQGCEPGSIGECAMCPLVSKCAKGQFQKCGEGVLGECQTCSNAPKGAEYTGSAMDATCPWKCGAGYLQQEGLDQCDPTCALFECDRKRYFIPVPDAAKILQHADENEKVCCQSSGCGHLVGKMQMSEATLSSGGCKALKTKADCEDNFVVSGNQKRVVNDGATIFTPCAWNGASCDWGNKEYDNCELEHIALKDPNAKNETEAAAADAPAAEEATADATKAADGKAT
eukprot:TRINITY_DN208_c0_g1_i3.p1 TRINITY_DN208_c0_g1~~TRINITY_DN208_c0_g1_i3.p1  ORF type:complete len:609 (-),score=149.84 TRINITY_DN208_c0_g1_i3:570-2315(-)